VEGKRRLPKMNDWSLNLEDVQDAGREELLSAAIEAVEETAPGYYVNLVTPGTAGHPETVFIPDLVRKLREMNIPVRSVQYIGECGCGGHVTRVYR
jgi:hypothetical protein